MERFHVGRGAATWLLTALAVALAGCGGDTPTDPNGGGGGGGGGPVVTTSVTVVDNDFQPAAIQVSPGATVTWTWSGTSNPHNVRFADASITDSPDQSSGSFATAMPTAAGTYAYECSFHASIGMTGTVLVQ